jgi:hypothetical protein
MPIVDFGSLPDDARVWVYGSDRPMTADATREMQKEVEAFLKQWAAHGTPLHSAWAWDDGRFLTIAVDSSREGASGCSIDGLYRALKRLEPFIGASIVTSGLVYYRNHAGEICAVSREEFAELAKFHKVDGETEVFDLSVTTVGEWKARFRSQAANSWHASLMEERGRENSHDVSDVQHEEATGNHRHH